MDFTASLKLIHANFFFVDIVGLSDTSMSTKTQIKKIETLNKCISDCTSFKSVPLDSLLLLPTGDGCCIGFMQGPELPLLLAVELHTKLAAYNKGKIPSETVRVRIGLHSGNCFLVNDLLGQRNTWGPGIIYARRVMDFGDDGHILLSPSLAEDLRSLSDEYRGIIKPVHDVILKHGTTMLLYSAYGDGFGNSKHPDKGASVRSKYGEEVLRLQKTTLYPSIDLILTVLDVEKMVVQHKRTYEVSIMSIVGFLGIGVTMMFFVMALRLIGAVRTVLIYSTTTVFSIVYSAVILSESISILNIISAGTVLFGLIVLRNRISAD